MVPSAFTFVVRIDEPRSILEDILVLLLPFFLKTVAPISLGSLGEASLVAIESLKVQGWLTSFLEMGQLSHGVGVLELTVDVLNIVHDSIKVNWLLLPPGIRTFFFR